MFCGFCIGANRLVAAPIMLWKSLTQHGLFRTPRYLCLLVTSKTSRRVGSLPLWQVGSLIRFVKPYVSQRSLMAELLVGQQFISPGNARSLCVLKSPSAKRDMYDLKWSSFKDGCLYTQTIAVFKLPIVISTHKDSKPCSLISACWSRLCGRSARS